MEELITPEGQAFSDYIEGKSEKDNPYTSDTVEHARYNVQMRKCEAKAKEND